ncbi:MFS transporter [uncultured Abyssibacter sp.]|uniref:MFS transporter n=1 Tax=uncultured Abyssibacter sp. TaxID=2320202 RepID=UPI0032B256CB
MPSNLPYARLSAFYAFYFSTLGLLLPFWSVYLDQAGYSASRIGVLLGAMLGLKIIAPYVWGQLADRMGRRLPIIRLAALLAAGAFLIVPLAPGFWPLLGIVVVFAFFWNAALPQFEVITFNYLREHAARYGQIRLWGSVGFIVASIGLGAWVERVGVTVLPYVVAAVMVMLALVASLLREPPAQTTHDPGPILRTLKQPVVIGLLGACALMQMSHGPYYGFYSLYIRSHGHGESLIGGLWALGVAAEILTFLFAPGWLRRFGPRRLMLVALGVAALRWALLAFFAGSLPMLLLIQCLHMGSFGLYHAVGVFLINRLFQGRQQGRGQALYSAISLGAGGGLGSLLGGVIWDHLPSPALFLFAAGAALGGWFVAWRLLRGSAMERAGEVVTG